MRTTHPVGRRVRRFIVMALVAGAMVLGAAPSHAATIFSEDFSDNAQGWSLGVTWEIGSATAGPAPSIGFPDPASDHTPTSDNGVAGVVIGGNYPNGLTSYRYLTSPAFDTTGYTNVDLSFWRWLNSDYPAYMSNQVQVYDGSSWQTVWSGPPAGVFLTESSWNLHEFDITAYQSAATQIRFGYNVSSAGLILMSGWNLDDILVEGTGDVVTAVPEPASLLLFGSGIVAFVSRRQRAR